MPLPEKPSANYAEIIESGFWQDPTDGVFIEDYYAQVYEEFIEAVNNGGENMWDLSDKLKLIGKFLPIDDIRNPDNPIYHH